MKVLSKVALGDAGESQVCELAAAVQREGAAMGLLITLGDVELHGVEPVEFGSSRYPLIQTWSIAKWLNGEPPVIPALADPFTGDALTEPLPVNQRFL